MRKILIIEDNKDVRENASEILRLEGYEVATAQNGMIGVEKAREFKPDIIVCDIMMPELDGYGVLRRLGEDRKTSSIPFIFLTAKIEKSDMRTGMNLGADDYLTKPFVAQELLDAIACRLKKNDFLRREITKDLEGINSFLEEASEYADLEGISKNRSIKKYSKKERVFNERSTAHSFYFIQSGNLKTSKMTESGKEYVTGLWGPGDFIGQLSLLNHTGNYTDTATVLEDAEICAIPKEDFTRLLYSNKVVARKFINMISNNLIEVHDKLANMAFASVRQRAAKALLDLYDKGIIKDKVEEGTGIAREDFAGIVGTATETAIRTLSNFKEERLIAMGSGGKITLLDKDELQHVANFR